MRSNQSSLLVICGLRDYGTPGQLGLESTPQEHVAAMVEVFREVKRVLRKDGTCWLNYGDSYACQKNGRAAADVEGDDRTFRDKPFSTVTPRKNGFDRMKGPNRSPQPDLKPKDLVGMPWRIAFGLQEDGWWLRSDIIWSKPNPMPESVSDRPTKSHEYLFLLAKSERYYYDAEAIREDAKPESVTRCSYGFLGNDPDRDAANNYGNGFQRGEGYALTGRNRRTVWTIPTEPYPEAHFATFPTDLVRPCILAGTSEKGCCSKCGKPWNRLTDRVPGRSRECPKTTAAHIARGGIGIPVGTLGKSGSGRIDAVISTTGWEPSCKCNAASVPCTVLDPFMGSGTTLQVALEYGRYGIGIELNPEYLKLAERRIKPYLAQELLAL